MEIYTEQGDSKIDCELKIASKYSRQFQILSQKEIRRGGFLGLFSKPGVQVEFYFPQRPLNSLTLNNPNMMNRLPANSFHAYTAPDSPQQKNPLDDEKMKVLAAASAASARQPSHNTGAEASQKILDALKELTEKVELSSAGKNTAHSPQTAPHPAFTRVNDLLKQNDFSESYINSMIEKMRKELTVEQLDNWDYAQDYLVELIGESISIYKEDPRDASTGIPSMRKPKVMVLVGPTGVGKTTTISKLAAIYGLGINDAAAIDVKMITIDAFRIGAKDQIEQTGNIMRIPVSWVANKQDLRKEIALLSEGTDLFLIDTIGKSPKDAVKLGEMKEILDGA